MDRWLLSILIAALIAALTWSGCGSSDESTTEQPEADLVLQNGRVYSLSWSEPGLDGSPADSAPFDDRGWHPDAEAIAVRAGKVVALGSSEEIRSWIGPTTRTIDLDGATVLPGMIDSHVHAVSYGELISRVSLLGIETEQQAVEVIRRAAESAPKGQWIVAWGFDEGAWTDRLPDKKLLSDQVPDHPVHAMGLHGFVSWENQLSLDRAGITGDTVAPVGGIIELDADGEPTGILRDNASDLYRTVLPSPTAEDLVEHARHGLQAIADLGYTAVHDAGTNRAALEAFMTLAEADALPLRVYVMLSIDDEELLREWIERGPLVEPLNGLTVRSVKAYYDASLGARGARLLEDYSDRPGHRGVSGNDYGFDRELAKAALAAGFQIGIHAIGDAGNRETLDFLESAFVELPDARDNRHRIEHAQIVHPDDQPRFGELGVIASMEPPHAVEDMAWAEQRLGADRVRHGYAWRTIRQAGGRLAFNSDLSGSDPNLFYGLHAAITRRNKQRLPDGGWFPEQALAREEAVRAYSTWNTYAAFAEGDTGTLDIGKSADMTITDIDPFTVDVDDLLAGEALFTIVGGRIAYEAGVTPPVSGALYTNPLVLDTAQ